MEPYAEIVTLLPREAPTRHFWVVRVVGLFKFLDKKLELTQLSAGVGCSGTLIVLLLG